MDGRFDVLVTVDKGIRHQRQLASRQLALVVLRARTNRLADLLPLVPRLLATLEFIEPGAIAEIAE